MDPLRELLAAKKAEIKELKAEAKKAKKDNNSRMVRELNDEISKLEQFVKRFGVSKMEPRQIGDIVINYKIYSRFMKKVKGFNISHRMKDNSLVIGYYSETRQGELVLYDLSHFFPGGSKFPKVETGLNIENG